MDGFTACPVGRLAPAYSDASTEAEKPLPLPLPLKLRFGLQFTAVRHPWHIPDHHALNPGMLSRRQ